MHFEKSRDARSHDWLMGRDNVWLGATIVNQEEAERDIPKLLQVPARVRFLSMEPLLGPVRLDRLAHGDERDMDVLRGQVSSTTQHVAVRPRKTGDRVDWVIAGGESGAGARPMSIQWARSLRDQCAAAGVPFLFKQWGEWAPAGMRPPETSGRSPSATIERGPCSTIRTGERVHFAIDAPRARSLR